MSQSKFEWKKILTAKTNYFGIIILLILLLPPIFISSNNADEIRMQHLQSALESGESAVQELKRDPAATQALKDTEETNELLRTLIDSYESGQEKGILEVEYAYEKKVLNDLQRGSLIGIPIREQKKIVSTLEYLVQNEVEKVDDMQDQVPAINYLYKVFNGLVPITIIFMVISLILTNIYSFEKRRNNINFLNTTPVSLYRISLNKIIISTTFVIVTLLGSLLITFLLGSLNNGVGNLNYPLAYTIDGVNVLIMSMSTFIVKSLILMIFFAIFLSALSFLISIFTGSILVNAIILIVTILISDSSFLYNGVVTEFAHLLPFSYVDASNVVTYGSYFKPLVNSSITFWNGILYLGIYSVILYVVSFLIIHKKKKI